MKPLEVLAVSVPREAEVSKDLAREDHLNGIFLQVWTLWSAPTRS